MSRPTKTRIQIVKDLDWRLRNFTTSAVLAASSIAQKVGMGINELKCAELLVRMGPMSAGKLAELAGLTTGAITGIVDRLEKAGWAKRVADPNDRRRVIIHPGPQETDVVDGLYNSYVDSLTNLLTGYSDDELILVTGFIDGLIKLNNEQANRLNQS
ncbi:MAG TPA: MarR family transcriptional regulator [Anaerolineales bacterium]|nr:MarR family transcriptional regulator [Anaerolineales bacterium]